MTALHSPLVEEFFGRDPLKGEDARTELIRLQGEGAIRTLVPLEGGRGASSVQIENRLKATARDLGPSIAPYLAQVIASAPWASKLSATPCYGGLQDAPALNEPLTAILATGRDFDAERMAVEALGYLGSHEWAYDLVEYSKRGVWRPGSAADVISDHPFEKLSSYVLEALARFLARAEDRDRCRYLVDQLDDFIRLREQQLPNHGPNSYQLVERHGSELTSWSIDPLIAKWGDSSPERLRRLCFDVVGALAPLRVAPFLLAGIASGRSELERNGASIALGEIRHPNAAQLLADYLSRHGGGPGLEWAFSTLYAVPIDWSACAQYRDDVLQQGGEPAGQLLYSMALRGEPEARALLLAKLDSPDPFNRWTAALGLARLLGGESRRHLANRAEEASDDLERCGLYAAQLIAGDEGAAGALHEAMCETWSLVLLRPVWKCEFVGAFRNARSFDHRAHSAWRSALRLGARHGQYFDELVAPPLAAAAPPARVAAPSRVAPGIVAVERAAPARLFISYSHREKPWLVRFQEALKPLVRKERVDLWDDTRIAPGKWKQQIEAAMAEANVALFLVSNAFLASEFIHRHELPELLAMAEKHRVTVLWVLLEDCLWEETPLADYQGENASEALVLMSPGEQARLITQTCRKIRDLLPGEEELGPIGGS